MAKNQSSRNSTRSSCGKICKATLGKIHRISQCPKDNVQNPPLPTTNSPTAKAHVSSTIPITLHQPTLGKEIPIEFDPPIEEKPNASVQKIVRFSLNSVVRDGGEGKELLGQKSFNDDKFTSYIERVKKKMRTMSNIGGGKSVSRRDSFNDRVSNYINRAKIKLRTTTTIGGGGGGQSVSFK